MIVKLRFHINVNKQTDMMVLRCAIHKEVMQYSLNDMHVCFSVYYLNKHRGNYIKHAYINVYIFQDIHFYFIGTDINFHLHLQCQ